MKISAGTETWHVRDETALTVALRWRDSVDGAMFWLGLDDAEFPCLAIRVHRELADVHWFAAEGQPGHRAMPEPHQRPLTASTLLVYEGCDPAAGEPVDAEFVLPFPRAVELAREFLRTSVRPSSIVWYEL